MALAAVASPSDDLRQLGPDDLVTVFLGKEQFAPKEFKDHPNVQFLTADSHLDFGHLREQVSPGSKAFITTEGIPHGLFQNIIGLAKSTNRPYVNRKHPNAVAVMLSRYFPDAKAKTGHLDANGDPMPERGHVKALLGQHPPDLSKPTTEEARRLFAIAQQLGTPTTLGTLVTSISKMKREAGRGEIPSSARRKNPTLEILTELEDMQIRLGLMKEFVQSTVDENTKLRTQMADMRRVLGIVTA